MRRTLSVLCLLFFVISSSGCALLLVGAGAGGGYYLAKDERSAGLVVKDASITGSVKTKLIKDDHVDGLNINVDTHAGVVTLNGHVESAGDAKRAVGLARSVKGVEKVVSKLVVLSD